MGRPGDYRREFRDVSAGGEPGEAMRRAHNLPVVGSIHHPPHPRSGAGRRRATCHQRAAAVACVGRCSERLPCPCGVVIHVTYPAGTLEEHATKQVLRIGDPDDRSG